MKTVAIVGSHPDSRDYAPYDRGYIDIWVFNEAASLGWPKRVNAVFQMHAAPIWKNPGNVNDQKHFEWLQKRHDYPIYMLEKVEEIPASVSYPLEDVCGLVAGLRRGRKNLTHLTPQPPSRNGKGGEVRYFTSSVAYALALAIHLGYERIEVYGVEMETDTEYSYQRDGVYFWMGVALGRGVEVVVHEKSGLFKAPLYGYEGDIELHEEHFTRRVEQLMPMLEEAGKRLDAANREQEKALRKNLTHLSPSPSPKRGGGQNGKGESKKEYFTTLKAQAQATIDVGALRGALEENERYLKKAKTMEAAAGAHLFARQEFERGVGQAQQGMVQMEAQMNSLGGQASLYWKAVEKGVEELNLTLPQIQSGHARPPSLEGKGEFEEKVTQAERMYAGAHEKFLKAAYEYGRRTGIYQENLIMLRTVDELIKAAGGEKAVRMISQSAGVQEEVVA